MLKKWLDRKMSVEEIEKEHMPTLSHVPQVPFGFINEQWEEIKSRAQEGDEWWHFKSPQETWNQLAGREGYSLVRDGEIVDSIVTVFS